MEQARIYSHLTTCLSTKRRQIRIHRLTVYLSLNSFPAKVHPIQYITSTIATTMPPERVATEASRFTKKTAAPTRPSLPRAAKSKSRYRTRARVGHIEDEATNDQEAGKTNEKEPPPTSPSAEKAIPPLLTNETALPPHDHNIDKPKTPATKILQNEEDLAAKADAVWALHRHHNHFHNQSPVSSPLRHHTPSMNASRRHSSTSSSSNEHYPGPPLADPRLSPSSNRQLLTERTKFAARWAADESAQAGGIPLEGYMIPKKRPGVLKGGEGGEDGDGDGEEVERWRPEKPVWESVVSEEDMRIWREEREDFERAWKEDEVAQRGGISLFDYMRRVPREVAEDAGVALLDPDGANSNAQNKRETRCECGRRTKETKSTWRGVGEKRWQSSNCGPGLNIRKESLESSNSGGSLFSGTSPRLPQPQEGTCSRQPSLKKLFDAESVSTKGSVEAPTTLQARLNSTSPKPNTSAHSNDSEPPHTFPTPFDLTPPSALHPSKKELMHKPQLSIQERRNTTINPIYKDAIAHAEDIIRLSTLITNLGPGPPNVEKLFTSICHWDGPGVGATPGTFFIATSPPKPPFSSLLKGKTAALESPPEVAPQSSGAGSWSIDWTTNLFTREELATIIDHSVENVHLDCPHCDLIIREGLPIPLMFAMKEKCVCTYPQLQAKGYRAQMKSYPISERGLKGKVALGDTEFERAVANKRRVIAEVVDRTEEGKKLAMYRENGRGRERSKITCKVRRGKMIPAKGEASKMSDLGVDSSSRVLQGREAMENREGEGAAHSGVEKKRKASSTTEKTSLAVKKTRNLRKR